MTVDVDRVLAEREERARADHVARIELNRRQRDRWRAEKQARRDALPHVVGREAAVEAFEPGQRYVMAKETVHAWDDGTDCEIVAAGPGDWLRERYARHLGVDGEAVQLAWAPA